MDKFRVKLFAALLAFTLCIGMLAPASAFADASSSGTQLGGNTGTQPDRSATTQPSAPDEDTALQLGGAGEMGEAKEPGEPAMPNSPANQYSTLEAATLAGSVAAVPKDPLSFVNDQMIVVLAPTVSVEEGIAAVEEQISDLSGSGNPCHQ